MKNIFYFKVEKDKAFIFSKQGLAIWLRLKIR